MSYFSSLAKTMNNKLINTENGALVHASSGHALLDLNFRASSLNYTDGVEAIKIFKNALDESPVEAVKWLYYLRDCRGGMGFRNLFRKLMIEFLISNPEFAYDMLKATPEYGYWKDLVVMYGMTDNKNIKETILKVYIEQLTEDLKNLSEKRPVSLAGKYAPTDTSKKESIAKMAKDMMTTRGISVKEYRKLNRVLRKYIDVVERKMSTNDWDEINYESVPSRANKIYKDAFERHDGKRFEKHIDAVLKGEEKRNVGQLFPHEILKQAERGYSYYGKTYKEDPVVEANWKSYPRTNLGKILVVEDRSGSMTTSVTSNLSAMDVADALTLLFSEQLEGDFKNSFITFSERPKIWRLPEGTLASRANALNKYREVENTNIKAVFDLVLKNACQNKLTQDEMPKTILILSDMEFDSATYSYYGRNTMSETLFNTIRKDYERAGYDLPRMVFWNLCGRTGGVPVKENKLGVALVSGFSPAILQMVLAGDLDPWNNLQDCLNAPRYDMIEEIIKKHTS